jgi:hypothetical protein
VTAPATTRHPLAQLAVVVFFGFPLIVLTLGAVTLPAVISYDLVRRGVTESHPGWLVMGTLTAALWLLLLGLGLRRRFRPAAG